MTKWLLAKPLEYNPIKLKFTSSRTGVKTFHKGSCKHSWRFFEVIKGENCLTSHISSPEHLLPLGVSCSALEFSQCLGVQGHKVCSRNHSDLDNNWWLMSRGQVVKSPNLSYTIPRASSLDSSILLSSEFSQCLRVQGQGCYTFSCISANASRELWSLRKQ